MTMKIYMESLYNYTGEWIDLVSIDKEELLELENKYSIGGQHDIIIADWEEIPFRINMYSNWMEIWNKVQLIERMDIEKGQIEILELLGYEFLKMDEYDIEQKIEEIYCINAENDEDFAYEYYSQIYNLDKEIPSVFIGAIDWSRLYRDLEIEMTITKIDDSYYYTY